MQHIEAVPAAFGCGACRADHAGVAGDFRGELQDRRAIRRDNRAGAQDNHRPLGVFQHLGKVVAAVCEVLSSAAMPVAQLLRPDRSDRLAVPILAILQTACQPGLADARIQHRRFPARIGADQQNASAASTPAMAELNR